MNTTDSVQRYLNVEQAAKYIGLAKPTLNKDRVTRLIGIPFCRVGRRILYDREVLDNWMASKFEQGA